MNEEAVQTPIQREREDLLADAHRALVAHLVSKAQAARHRYGKLDGESILRLLADPSVVRRPVTLHFDRAPLQPGELAFASPVGFHAGDGYALIVHPWLEARPEWLPLVVALHIPLINYGPVIEEDQAIEYGAALLGMTADAYYEALCVLLDAIQDEDES